MYLLHIHESEIRRAFSLVLFASDTWTCFFTSCQRSFRWLTVSFCPFFHHIHRDVFVVIDLCILSLSSRYSRSMAMATQIQMVVFAWKYWMIRTICAIFFCWFLRVTLVTLIMEQFAQRQRGLQRYVNYYQWSQERNLCTNAMLVAAFVAIYTFIIYILCDIRDVVFVANWSRFFCNWLEVRTCLN